jgi:hypothetical protein
MPSPGMSGEGRRSKGVQPPARHSFHAYRPSSRGDRFTYVNFLEDRSKVWMKKLIWSARLAAGGGDELGLAVVTPFARRGPFLLPT